MTSSETGASDASQALSADPERASRLDAALEHAQREERSELVDDIARQQATDARFIDALTRTHPGAVSD